MSRNTLIFKFLDHLDYICLVINRFVKVKQLLLGLSILLVSGLFAQTYDGVRGYSTYQKYDKSQISPEKRRKHSISLGFQNAWTTPFDFDNGPAPDFGMNIGYNFLILKSRKRLLSTKGKHNDEVALAFGWHHYIQFQKKGEWFSMATVYRPLLGLKGTMFSVFALNEIGLGFHRTNDPPNVAEGEEPKGPISLMVYAEGLRFRIGRALAIHTGFTWAFRNDLLDRNFNEMSWISGIRYYIYRRK